MTWMSHATANVSFCLLHSLPPMRSSYCGACLACALGDTDLKVSLKTTWLVFPVSIENNGAFIGVTACQNTAHTPTGDLCLQLLATETVPNTIIKTVAKIN